MQPREDAGTSLRAWCWPARVVRTGKTTQGGPTPTRRLGDSLRKSIPQPSTSRFLGFGPGTSTCLATEHGNFYSNGPRPNCLMSEAEVILDPALSSSPILVLSHLPAGQLS